MTKIKPNTKPPSKPPAAAARHKTTADKQARQAQKLDDATGPVSTSKSRRLVELGGNPTQPSAQGPSDTTPTIKNRLAAASVTPGGTEENFFGTKLVFTPNADGSGVGKVGERQLDIIFDASSGLYFNNQVVPFQAFRSARDLLRAVVLKDATPTETADFDGHRAVYYADPAREGVGALVVDQRVLFLSVRNGKYYTTQMAYVEFDSLQNLLRALVAPGAQQKPPARFSARWVASNELRVTLRYDFLFERKSFVTERQMQAWVKGMEDIGSDGPPITRVVDGKEKTFKISFDVDPQIIYERKDARIESTVVDVNQVAVLDLLMALPWLLTGANKWHPRHERIWNNPRQFTDLMPPVTAAHEMLHLFGIDDRHDGSPSALRVIRDGLVGFFKGLAGERPPLMKYSTTPFARPTAADMNQVFDTLVRDGLIEPAA